MSSPRRSFERVALPQPARGRLGQSKAFVHEVSITDARVLHQGRVSPGEECELTFEWEGHSLRFIVSVVETELERLSKESAARSIYRSVLAFERGGEGSTMALRELIAQQVMRALDEQKANAKGIPAIAANSMQRGAIQSGYITYRWSRGQWSRMPTTSPVQPLDGFTVSSEENSSEVELLCSSYEAADESGRAMIRQLAELSIEAAGGVPTRRYQA